MNQKLNYNSGLTDRQLISRQIRLSIILMQLTMQYDDVRRHLLNTSFKYKLPYIVGATPECIMSLRDSLNRYL